MKCDKEHGHIANFDFGFNAFDPRRETDDGVHDQHQNYLIKDFHASLLLGFEGLGLLHDDQIDQRLRYYDVYLCYQYLGEDGNCSY